MAVEKLLREEQPGPTEVVTSAGRFQKAFKADFERLLNNWNKGDYVRDQLQTRLSAIFE